MELTSFKTDENLKAEAQWFDYEDGRVLVARDGNRKYQNELTRLTSGLFLRMRGTQMSQEQTAKLELAQKKATSQFILLDWENFTLNGEAVKYEPSVGLQVFKDHHSFFQTIQEFSAQVARDMVEEREEAEKNSSVS